MMKLVTPTPPSRKWTRRFNNLNDCKRYVASLINRLESGEVDPNVASKSGYLVQIIVKILEASDLEKRLEALEQELRQR